MVSSVQILLIKVPKENGSETQTTWKVEVRSRRKKQGRRDKWGNCGSHARLAHLPKLLQVQEVKDEEVFILLSLAHVFC